MLLAEKDAPSRPTRTVTAARSRRCTRAARSRRCAKRGVEHISYTCRSTTRSCVCSTPCFLGLHATSEHSSGGDEHSKVCPQGGPGREGRRPGYCATGRPWSSSTRISPRRWPSAATSRAPELQRGEHRDSRLGVEFVRAAQRPAAEFALPLHRAVKKVPHVDLDTGERVDPDEPNAVKLESFVFDALPIAERSLVLRDGPDRRVRADQERVGQ